MLYNYDDNQKQEPPMQANAPNHNNKPLGLQIDFLKEHRIILIKV